MVIRVLVACCALFVCSWWTFDGAHAMVKGDLVTPQSGKYAGQYGPWSKIVSAIGINPRSQGMHRAFLVMGIIGCAMTIAWLVLGNGSHAQAWWWGMISLGVCQLWYLPFGTVFGLIQIVLLIVLRKGQSGA